MKQPDKSLREKVAELLFKDRYSPYKWEQATKEDKEKYSCLASKILALLPQATEEVKECDLVERTAQCIAHRACCGSEHNPQEGKLHGYCVVCGVPWPCEYVEKNQGVAHVRNK